MLPARAADTPPSARGEISAAAGDGGEIIPRRGRGDNHPGQSRYAGIWQRGCMRYRRRSEPPSGRGCWPCKQGGRGKSSQRPGTGGQSSGPERGKGNHPGQSRYAAIWPGMYAVLAVLLPERAKS